MKKLLRFGITPDHINDLGYIDVSEYNDGENGYYVFVSTNKARKHVIKGFNQPLGNAQRYININASEDDSNYFYIGIKCDGRTRTLIDGICRNLEDFNNIITLVD